MANWKPSKSVVHWHLPGGEILPETTTWTDTGDHPNPPINTAEGLAARYANGSIPERNGVHAHLWGQADDNPILSAAMERAGKDKNNPWGLSENDYNNPTSVLDFGATEIGPEGLDNSKIMQLYPVTGKVGDWPVHPGDSTDPAHRTERRILGPHGNYEKVVGGTTYYYFNPRKDQPGDPWFGSTGTTSTTPSTAAPVTPPTTASATTPVSTAALSQLKSASSDLQKILPLPGVGGAPIQKLAREVRKLLAVIDNLGL